ncbi:MAG: NYN domain-containing protein, partial [Actinomycetes bacterium]
EADRAVADAAAEARRVRAQLARVEAELVTVRRSGRQGRTDADSRARLLLDTLVAAAQGLRRELALPAVTAQPADAVAELAASAGSPDWAGQVGTPTGPPLDETDPALLDQLLGLPRVHLVVDGYNVTKTAYPWLSLAQQRHRLVMGLAAVAARTGAEITCCFDGALLDAPVPAPSVRGVRVLFSRPGSSADDLVRALVRAEPQGRPVLVVSSDREVADGVRAAGARALASVALARLLGSSVGGTS